MGAWSLALESHLAGHASDADGSLLGAYFVDSRCVSAGDAQAIGCPARPFWTHRSSTQMVPLMARHKPLVAPHLPGRKP